MLIFVFSKIILEHGGQFEPLRERTGLFKNFFNLQLTLAFC